MGIQGLLPFLKKVSHPASMKDFKGCTVAIDSYCWLHKGAFACAEKLAMGEKTDQYVYYCMKYINNLLSLEIKPIMVFDGCHLPSKRAVEKARRERRETYRKKAAQFMREGKRSEARDCLTKCIDITSEMALELMNVCRSKGVDCIVAPYEADSQLAYLDKIGVAQIIITEDSDLLLFGCRRIMFKMDVSGNGIMIERQDLNKVLNLSPDVYTFEKFRYMCILSGCDYLPNLPGIGLGKSLKVFQATRQTDIKLILKKLPSILNSKSLTVSNDYIDSFIHANNTFLYQLVFCPLERKLKPLNSYPDGLDPRELTYAGPYLPEEKAYQIALGNYNVNTGEKIAHFDPDISKTKSHHWDDRKDTFHLCSIWDPSYRAKSSNSFTTGDQNEKSERQISEGKETSVSAISMRRKNLLLKRQREEEVDNVLTEATLASIYKGGPTPASATTQAKNKRKREDDNEKEQLEIFVQMGQIDHDVKCDYSNRKDSIDESLKNRDSNIFFHDGQIEARSDRTQVRSTGTNLNKFALPLNKLKEKFNLNSSKNEVQSRFFTFEQPLRKTSFFEELEKNHEQVPRTSSREEQKGNQQVAQAKLSSCVKNKERSFIKSSCSTTTSSPYQTFKKFKTHLDQPGSSLSCSPGTRRQFKPVCSQSKVTRPEEILCHSSPTDSLTDPMILAVSGMETPRSAKICLTKHSFNLYKINFESSSLSLMQDSKKNVDSPLPEHNVSTTTLITAPAILPEVSAHSKSLTSSFRYSSLAASHCSSDKPTDSTDEGSKENSPEPFEKQGVSDVSFLKHSTPGGRLQPKNKCRTMGLCKSTNKEMMYMKSTTSVSQSNQKMISSFFQKSTCKK